MLSIDRLKELLTYDPSTGSFFRNLSRGGYPAGSRAGTKHNAGYESIIVDYRPYLSHRLAWFYMTGQWPLEIDHRDGNRSNNQWDNLRLATRTLNNVNAKKRTDNVSGFKGVGWCRAAQKWRAYIRYGKHQVHLGLFDDPMDAHLAYCGAAKMYYGEFARAA